MEQQALIIYLKRKSFRVASASGGSYSNKVTVREWMRRISGYLKGLLGRNKLRVTNEWEEVES